MIWRALIMPARRLALVAVTTLLCALPAASFAADSQSLASTTAWLAAHLPASISEAGNAISHSLTYAFDGCALTIKDQEIAREDIVAAIPAQQVAAVQFAPRAGRAFSLAPLAIGDSADLKTHFYTWKVRVDLRAVSPASIAAETVTTGSSGRTITGFVTILQGDRIRLQVAGAGAASRIAAALRHAVSLCNGGQKS